MLNIGNGEKKSMCKGADDNSSVAATNLLLLMEVYFRAGLVDGFGIGGSSVSGEI